MTPKPVATLVPAKPAGAGEPLRWECVIPGVPDSLNAQYTKHWSRRRKDGKPFLWWMRLGLSIVPRAAEHRTVTFTRCGHGMLDDDNLAAAFKGMRDYLRPERAETGIYGPKTKHPGGRWFKVQAGLGLILGDGPGQAAFVYHQERIPKSQTPYTRIVIEVT